jgi:secondary thiamine-phosphate synthase enzyme
MIYREILEFDVKSDEYIDITSKIAGIVENCQIRYGICHVFLQATTSGLLMNEEDPMLLADFKKLFDEVAPKKKLYQHPKNGFSHLRAAMLKQDLSIPISDGKLMLGKWQSILLWNHDTRARKRTVVVTVSD